MSEGALFVRVMPAFESLVAASAVAGWARRAGIDYGSAKEYVYATGY
jgi:hypothetical protein